MKETCRIERGNTLLFRSEERGIAPLLTCIRRNLDVQGSIATDTIVGKAAALLYVYMGIREVHAEVMSEAAAETLRRHQIPFHAQVMTKSIRNRTGTGICPMEETVAEVSDPTQAFFALEKKWQSLQPAVQK